MIDPENLEFKGLTRKNKQYSVVGQPLDWRNGYNLELLKSIDINGKAIHQGPGNGWLPSDIKSYWHWTF